MSAVERDEITSVVLGLDRWFQSMRVDWPTPGFGGAVVHWWNHCLAYRGAGLDWRYEGIIDGYLALWRQTRNSAWLNRAVQAGEDLVAGQTADGHFRNSRFELNPGEGGTPHEAACDVGLLLLAKELRALGDPTGNRFLRAAERNLADCWFARLWHQGTATLRDDPNVAGFVPNKAATFVEAVLLLSELTRDDELVDRFGIPTGDHILGMQVHHPGDVLDGAIAQNRFGTRVVESYFPLYVARCVPALFQLASTTGELRFRVAALAAGAFVARVRDRESDGGLPQVLYPGGRSNRLPRWVAGAGDVVRALDLTREQGLDVKPDPTIAWVVRGARADGRIVSADGFGRMLPWVSRRDQFADELGVVGWCDKAFRALARYCDSGRLSDVVDRARPESESAGSVLR